MSRAASKGRLLFTEAVTGCGTQRDLCPAAPDRAPARAGTIAYMSPELLQHGRLTKLNDVYSFAMLLIELWSSRRLFQGLSQQQACSPLHSIACVWTCRPYLPGHALGRTVWSWRTTVPCSKTHLTHTPLLLLPTTSAASWAAVTLLLAGCT